MRSSLLCAIAVFAGLPSLAHAAGADDVGEKEPTILELGSAAEWGLNDGESAFGPSLSLQTSPFANDWELEAGVAPLFRSGRTEWQTDLELQIPFNFLPHVEFNMGFGPEWVHAVDRHGISDSVSGEFTLDFVYWPNGEHSLGFFLEPGLEYDFGKDHDWSFALAAGIAIPLD